MKKATNKTKDTSEYAKEVGMVVMCHKKVASVKIHWVVGAALCKTIILSCLLDTF